MSALVLFGFTASAQNEPSLGEVARQTRNERTLNKLEATPAASEARRLAAELDREQEDVGSVPTGFQSYSAEGYRLFIPAPFSVEGRNDTGVLLATANVTGLTTKVFAAKPIAVLSRPSDVEFQELAREFWRPYGSIACEKPKPGVRGHECTVSGTLFGNQFNGHAHFVEGDSRIVPVVCFATSLVNNNLDYSIHPRTKEELDDLRADGLRNMHRQEMAYASNQLCDTVFDSIRLKEEYNHSQATPLVRVVKVSPTFHREVATDGASLGDIARQARKEAAHQVKAQVKVEAEDTINAPPPGFLVHSNMRCEEACWQETFFLPENARRVKGGNSDNVYVDMLDENTSVVIYFGRTAVSYGYSEYGTAQDVARKWLHARGDWGANVSHLTRTVNGQEVNFSRARLAANLNVWIEEDAMVEGNDINFSIGCIAREDRLADAEAVCSTIWDSWRIHR